MSTTTDGTAATYWTNADGTCSHAQTRGNGNGLSAWCTRCNAQVSR